MHNWCEGKLKVYGSKENLTRFLIEGCVPIDTNCMGIREGILCPDDHGDFDYVGVCYIEGTSGGFIDSVHTNMTYYDMDVKFIMVFDARFSWNINAAELLKLCKKYDVDMRIFAFEKRQEFNRNIIIVDKDIKKDRTITFKDYDWECIDPTMGG